MPNVLRSALFVSGVHMDYYDEIRRLMFEWVERKNLSADRLAYEIEEILDEVQCEMGDE